MNHSYVIDDFINTRQNALVLLRELLEVTSTLGAVGDIAEMLETKVTQTCGYNHGLTSEDYMVVANAFKENSSDALDETGRISIIDGRTRQISSCVTFDNGHDGFFPKYAVRDSFECPCREGRIYVNVTDDGHGDVETVVTIDCVECDRHFIARPVGESFTLFLRTSRVAE